MDKLILHYLESEESLMAKEKKRDNKSKSTLSSMQEVSYSRDFKMADQAGGYTKKQARH
jgi:YfhE-like protein